MDWFWAYLLWKLEAVRACVGFGILALMAATTTRLVRQYAKNYKGEHEFPDFVRSQRSHARRMAAICICTGALTMFFFALPTTDQVFKIAATKYAADAITSDTTKEKLKRASDLVDDGMRVLHEKLKEVKGDKK